jgi:hypothetical protein
MQIEKLYCQNAQSLPLSLLIPLRSIIVVVVVVVLIVGVVDDDNDGRASYVAVVAAACVYDKN